MACKDCDNEPKQNTNGAFPKAPIQINNDNYTLFSRVNVPASLGDETETPPAVGKYRNVLLVYEVNGHAYLYSSDGIPTNITDVAHDFDELTNRPKYDGEEMTGETDIPNVSDVIDDVANLTESLAAEATTRANADSTLQNNITAEATTRASADEILQGNIDTEASTREGADTALGNRITAEEAARTTTDVTLQANIDAEASAREEADSDLSTAISNEATARAGADTALQTAIEEEASTRSQADVTLQNNINIEAAARESADTALDGKIIAEATARSNADAALQANIDDEVSSRETADATLQGNIDIEATARENADSDLQNAIDAEAEARAQTDVALGTRIGAAETALSTAVSTLEGEISGEATARENADTALQGNIDAEASTRSSADNTLQANINAEATARGTADTALQTAITNEETARTEADTALATRLATVEETAGTALQSDDIDYTVMSDINIDANPSTSVLQLDTDKVNLSTGVTSTKNIALPVASSTQAGVMNSATFDAVTANTTNINALMNGAVAISNLPEAPTQAQLTAAWEEETGLTSLINRASIYDVTNEKVWTYYTNDTTWHVASNTTQVDINTFTNTSAGTIMGSTNDGQIYAENDGTGSVNGWDELTSTVADHTSQIAAKQNAETGKGLSTNDFTTAEKDKLGSIAAGAEVNVQADWAETDSEADDYIKNKPAIPTVNNAVLTIQKNGSNVATFTANSATATTANITVPTKTSDLTNDSGYVADDSLAAVATSGSYNDLTDKPTIPTVNNATLTIQKNGTSVGTFTANSATATTANITVPTKTSELTNDSNYVASTSLASVATTGSYKDLADKPTISNVNDATLTIQNNGSTVGTFTANSETDVTANIIPPVQIGDTVSEAASVAYVDTANIKNTAVTTAKLATSSVTTAKLATSSVTTAKLATSSVTTTKIADKAVTSDKIDFTTFDIKDIEVGQSPTSSVTTRSVSFSRTHTVAPTIVVATFYGAVTTGIVSVSVNGLTATGFKMTPRYHLTSGEWGPASEPIFWAAFWT